MIDRKDLLKALHSAYKAQGKERTDEQLINEALSQLLFSNYRRGWYEFQKKHQEQENEV
jgi:hypothetical protein